MIKALTGNRGMMGSVASMFSRVYQAFSPPHQPAKVEDALKFGILGAANIAYVRDSLVPHVPPY